MATPERYTLRLTTALDANEIHWEEIGARTKSTIVSKPKVSQEEEQFSSSLSAHPTHGSTGRFAASRKSDRRKRQLMISPPKRRRRASKKCIFVVSESSPALQTPAADDGVISTGVSSDLTRYVFARAIQQGDVLKSIYSLSTGEGLLHTNSHKALEMLEDSRHFPLNLVLVRPSREAAGPSRRARKRRKKIRGKQKKSPPAQVPQVISILTSSDEEKEVASPQMEDHDTAHSAAQAPSINNDLLLARPDPTPAYVVGAWVVTSMGAGRVVGARVDRLVTPQEQQPNLIACPLLMYKIQLSYGVVYVPSLDVHTLETSSWGKDIVLTYNTFTLRRQDVVRLRPGVYLNDSLVNFYLLAYLRHRYPNRRIHTFSSFFYSHLVALDQRKQQHDKTDQKNAMEHRQFIWKTLGRWTKDVNVLSMDWLVIPVHDRLHWSFLVVCHPGVMIESSFSRFCRPCVLHLDSGKRFGLHRSSTLYARVRKYLNACREQTMIGSRAGDRDGSVESSTAYFTKDTLPGVSPPTPAQVNETDCGMHMLEMMERFLNDPIEITQKFLDNKGNSSPFGNDCFGQEAIDRKRHQFQSLLYTLAQTQGAE